MKAGNELINGIQVTKSNYHNQKIQQTLRAFDLIWSHQSVYRDIPNWRSHH